ncbi:hypothetical protein [Undibacterium sp. TJN19]|uniref:hypothetical protein n=1 Tax=Undibacterium sp. TJN19 TaxID=3413055 RepID=UPI003BEFAD16
MATPMEEMEKKLSTGQLPSYDELEATLAQCLSERNAYEGMTKEFGNWMSALVTAHVQKDALAIKNILDSFIEKRVKFIPAVEPQIH